MLGYTVVYKPRAALTKPEKAQEKGSFGVQNKEGRLTFDGVDDKGIKTYKFKLLGFFRTQIQIGDQTYVVNKNSLGKFAARFTKIQGTDSILKDIQKVAFKGLNKNATAKDLGDRVTLLVKSRLNSDLQPKIEGSTIDRNNTGHLSNTQGGYIDKYINAVKNLQLIKDEKATLKSEAYSSSLVKLQKLDNEIAELKREINCCSEKLVTLEASQNQEQLQFAQESKRSGVDQTLQKIKNIEEQIQTQKENLQKVLQEQEKRLSTLHDAKNTLATLKEDIQQANESLYKLDPPEQKELDFYKKENKNYEEFKALFNDPEINHTWARLLYDANEKAYGHRKVRSTNPHNLELDDDLKIVKRLPERNESTFKDFNKFLSEQIYLRQSELEKLEVSKKESKKRNTSLAQKERDVLDIEAKIPDLESRCEAIDKSVKGSRNAIVVLEFQKEQNRLALKNDKLSRLRDSIENRKRLIKEIQENKREYSTTLEQKQRQLQREDLSQHRDLKERVNNFIRSYNREYQQEFKPLNLI